MVFRLSKFNCWFGLFFIFTTYFELMNHDRLSVETIIMSDFSGAHADFLAQVAIENPDFMAQLVEIAFANQEPLSRRAAWPLRKVFDSQSDRVTPYLDLFAEKLPQLRQESVLRTIGSILARTEIPEKHHGALLEFCFGKMQQSGTSIAVLANCMDIFYQIASREPDLLRELELIFEIITPGASPGIKSKMNIIRRKMNKMKPKK